MVVHVLLTLTLFVLIHKSGSVPSQITLFKKTNKEHNSAVPIKGSYRVSSIQLECSEIFGTFCPKSVMVMVMLLS